MRCRICSNEENNNYFRAREMMFGLRKEFDYFECAVCGCVQIVDILPDMDKYYPLDYYSFSLRPSGTKNPVKIISKRIRDRYAISNKGIVGRLLYKIKSAPELRSLGAIHLKKTTRILDIGCGTGALVLHPLRELGFNNVLGVDPFIDCDMEYPSGLRILKCSIEDIKGEWDVVMMHHSYEHVSDPVESLQKISKLMVKGGTCLIRIPTVSSYAWQHYRENWVQLDPPRHFFLHSVRSIEILADMASLKLQKVIYDSTEFQFTGSEQILKDVPLRVGLTKGFFSKSAIRKYRKQAQQLNAENQGDQACFYLVKS